MCTQKKPLFHLHFGLKVPEDKMWSNVTWNITLIRVIQLENKNETYL